MTTERPKPYVGVSGVVNMPHIEPSGLVVREPQQLFVEAKAQRAGLSGQNRLLALGVKATHKTQFLDETNKYGRDWYPVGEQEFADTLAEKEKHPYDLGVAQVYMDPTQLSGDPGYFHEFMNRVHRRGSKWLQAVQYDMLPWQDNDKLLRNVDITRRYFQTQSIVQCHERAMDELGPVIAIRELGKYATGIDYVLFDASYGTGKRMNVKRLDIFLEEAYSSEELSHVGFGVAGGLDATSVREDIPALLSKYPDLSWDAESKLHPLNNRRKRTLQMDFTGDYLQASVDVLTGKAS